MKCSFYFSGILVNYFVKNSIHVLIYKCIVLDTESVKLYVVVSSQIIHFRDCVFVPMGNGKSN